MDTIILDARSLQLASEVLGRLDAKALLARRPFPEQPALEEAWRRALAEKLARLLEGTAESQAFSAEDVDALVRCCRGSEEAAALEGAPWPHAWRYESLFLHLAERRPDSVGACQQVVAGLLLPQLKQSLHGAVARGGGESRSGHGLPPSLFEEERERLGQQLAALEALCAPAHGRHLR